MKKTAVYTFSVLSALIVVLYLVSCFTPYINPVGFWPMTFLAMGFPLLAICVMLLVITWFFINKKAALVFLILFFVGYKNITAVFVLRPPIEFNKEKDTAALRVITWNVKIFQNNLKKIESPHSTRRQMMNLLHQMNADILLIQEFFETNSRAEYSNIQTLKDSLGYKYYYTSLDQVRIDGKTRYTTGCVIFSKFPFVNQQRFAYSGLESPESLSYTDIIFKGKILRVATTHLASLNLGPPPDHQQFYGTIEKDFIFQPSLFQKIKYYDSIHASQAVFVKTILNQSPYPLIMSGDFNSVPGSFAYHTIMGELQDAFVEKGSGLGRTYSGLSPTLRIDYLLADKRLEVLQYTCPQLWLSDHFPVVADFKWKE